MVVSAPQTGHVKLQGSGFSYKAASDFQGRDFFSLIVSGAINKVPGTSTIEVESPPPPGAPAGSATSSPPQPPPVNDLCGSSNDVAVSSAPTTNLCSTCTASAVSGSGPWRWSCISDGGTTAQCSAPVKTASLVQKPGPSAIYLLTPITPASRITTFQLPETIPTTAPQIHHGVPCSMRTLFRALPAIASMWLRVFTAE